jgi:hypothetical protein
MDFKRLIRVQVSPNRYVVCEPQVVDWEWKVCTKPLDYSDSVLVLAEMSEKRSADWSELTVRVQLARGLWPS